MPVSNLSVQLDSRLATYGTLASELALLSDKHLLELLRKATSFGASIGGQTALLKFGKSNIFVKKVPITDIEKEPENIMSTTNIFGLPQYCQYGIGSPGFGVWRELAIHTMCTNWVITGQCSNFPLMYHWRRLPKSVSKAPTSEEIKELESSVEFWNGSPAIRKRLEEKLKASVEIVLFLEYIPENLHQWLHHQILKSDDAAESAFKMVESELKTVTSFINSHGLLHFDAHFMNILTDGRKLYFSDFGLATSNQFELSKSELVFFKQHKNYDKCYTMAYLVEWILTQFLGSENWFSGNHNTILHEYANGRGKSLPPFIESLVIRYLPIAVVMNAFFLKLKKCKETPYPTDELDRACNVVDQKA